MSIYRDYLRTLIDPLDAIPTFAELESGHQRNIIDLKLQDDYEWTFQEIQEAILSQDKEEEFVKLFMADDANGLLKLITKSTYSYLKECKSLFDKDIEDAIRSIDTSDHYDEPDAA